jgi:16S rRNA (guanine1516-N2)-methyltransferase
MLERNPVVALLDDGLARGYADPEIGPWLQERLQLIHASSLTALTDITPRPQVVYLDPMFPHKQKSALVKKRCACFSRWWGRIWMRMGCWSRRVSWRPNGWW